MRDKYFYINAMRNLMQQFGGAVHLDEIEKVSELVSAAEHLVHEGEFETGFIGKHKVFLCRNNPRISTRAAVLYNERLSREAENASTALI